MIFVSITKKQWVNLCNEYKSKGPFSIKEYTQRLNSLCLINNVKKIEVFVLNTKERETNIVSICPYNIDLTKEINMMNTTMNNIFKNVYKFNVDDFSIPKKCMVIFRSYSWPFINKFNDHIFHLFQQTFRGKGLIRNGVNHEGSFSMYGPRTSKKSNGNLLMQPINA